jgi:glycosyltransferase involved in cell wall biosynthesis
MSKGPRVLFLARHLDSGGVTTIMMALAEELMSRGWKVALASRGQLGNHSHGPKWFELHGVEHFYVPFPGPYLSFQNLIDAGRTFFRMNSVVRQFQPDIIHVHWRSTSLYACLIQLTRRIPFVTTLHLNQIPSGQVYRLGSFWGARAIAISRETHDYLINSFGVRSWRIRTIYNGVDEEYFRPPTEAERARAREDFELDGKARVVSLIGRLEMVKGHDVLIKALAKLRDRGTDIVALLAGEGRQAKAILQLASEVHVADLVHLLGYADSRKVLWASDALVLPSRQEGFPVTVVEAMLCGVVPLRTPASGAFDQIENGVDGFIVPFDDHEALARRLEQLFDHELRIRMARAALNTAQRKFTKCKMTDDTIQLYEEVLGVCHAQTD